MKNKSHILIPGLLVALITVGHAKEAAGEAQRKADNTARIGKMDEYMRPKVRAVLTDLEGHGYRPLIDAGVWRSQSEQLAKVRAGNSWVRWSFHNASTPSGKPDSLAADITDIRSGWNSGNQYWLMLAAAAESHDLTTGIYWGLSPANRERIHTLIATRNWKATYQRGKDAAHTEAKGISLVEARRGVRPR